MQQQIFSRRSFLKGAVVLGASVSAGGMLAACAQESGAGGAGASAGQDASDGAASESASTSSSNTSSSSNASNSSNTSGSDSTSSTNTSQSSEQTTASSNENAASQQTESSSSDQAATQATNDSVLVAYFSMTGHTQRVAEAIAADLGAATFVITPAEPYTSADLDYNNTSSRVYTEHEVGGVDVALTQVTPDNFAQYDTVFVGYPTWWGEASWVLRTFVQGNDFTGKTVVPFTTSASSPLGSSAQNLAALCGTGNWLEGRRFGGSASASEVSDWLREIGY